MTNESITRPICIHSPSPSTLRVLHMLRFSQDCKVSWKEVGSQVFLSTLQMSGRGLPPFHLCAHLPWSRAQSSGYFLVLEYNLTCSGMLFLCVGGSTHHIVPLLLDGRVLIVRDWCTSWPWSMGWQWTFLAYNVIWGVQRNGAKTLIPDVEVVVWWPFPGEFLVTTRRCSCEHVGVDGDPFTED